MILTLTLLLEDGLRCSFSNGSYLYAVWNCVIAIGIRTSNKLNGPEAEVSRTTLGSTRMSSIPVLIRLQWNAGSVAANSIQCPSQYNKLINRLVNVQNRQASITVADVLLLCLRSTPIALCIQQIKHDFHCLLNGKKEI